MRLQWSADALADLDRFARFLHEPHPALARAIGRKLTESAHALADHPQIGRALGQTGFRQVVFRALNANYVLQYRVEGSRIVILRGVSWPRVARLIRA